MPIKNRHVLAWSTSTNKAGSKAKSPLSLVWVRLKSSLNSPKVLIFLKAANELGINSPSLEEFLRKNHQAGVKRPEEIVWDFWAENKPAIPNLAIFARNLALLQPTSAGAER